MDLMPSDRLQLARKRIFDTGSEAARAHGWTVSTYLAHENGQNAFREKTAATYGKAFKVSWVWLISGDPQSAPDWFDDEQGVAEHMGMGEPSRPDVRRGVPIMGYIGAGAEIDPDVEQIPPEGLARVDIPFSMPHEMIGFEVRGDSMLPHYEDGDLVVCFRDQRRPIAEFIGKEVALRTADGKRYFKRLAHGPKRGTYNLESWNARTIEGVRIAWIGEIIATVKGEAVRRVGERA